MKTKQLLLTFALLLTAGVAQAQSTYTWSVANWVSDGNGSFTTSDNTLTTTAYNWGCCGIKTTASFKLPKRQTFLVIKGTHIADGPTNPCLYNVNGTDLGYRPKLTVNAEGTLAYVDITGLLPAETDFFGNVSISQIGIYLEQPGGEEAANTITSIDFVAADILDLVEISNITVQGGSPVVTGDAIATDVSVSRETGEFKKTLSFTQASTNGDMGILVQGISQQLNNSGLYFVVESNLYNLNSYNRLKLRNCTMDGVQYSNNNGGASVNGRDVSTDVGSGHYLYIHSFFTNSETSVDLLNAWKSNTTKNASQFLLYINNSSGTDVTIYRMGFYNLAEIMALYPSLSTVAWRWQWPTEGHIAIEQGGDANKIKINNNLAEANTNTTGYVTQMVRSLGVLPSYYTTLEFRKFSFADGQTPVTDDIFRDMPLTLTTIFMSSDEYTFFPTMKTNVKVAGYGYSQYKDGILPQDVTKINDGGSPKAWSSYTRYFKEGYNSCCLPFNKPQYASLPSGLQVYTISGFNDGELTFAKQTANSEDSGKGIPVIVHADAEGYYMIIGRDPISTYGEAFDTYYKAVEAPTSSRVYFVGSFVNKVPDSTWAAGENCVNYGITADATSLAKMKSTTKTTFYRAFISDKRTDASVKALSLSFDEGDGTTKIVAPEEIHGLEMTSGNVYNLQGVRMTSDKLPRGIYVRNGKKFVVK